MLKLLLNGIHGQMGQAVLRTLPAYAEQIVLVAGIDPVEKPAAVPVYPSADAVDTDFDAAIDFSIPAASMAVLDLCVKRKKPLVLCTTGLNDEQLARVDAAAEVIPVLRSGNMSLGIHLMRALCAKARATLGDAYDVEIVETHHNRKIDAPSGTAKMLAETILEASAQPMDCVYGRHDGARRRAHNEIGIHSLRGGTVVGEHEVLFFGNDETLSIRHQAQSKGVFATGALRAALFLAQKPAGRYSMEDLVRELL